MSTSRRALSIEIREHIAEVTLLGPGRGNALGPELWRELPEAFAALDGDDAVRTVLLRGSGDHFTYGLDLIAMAGELGPLITGETTAGPRTELLALIRRLQAAVNAVADCRKPVIAAVHGWCIGGGLDIASAADLRLCSAEAVFSLRETRVAMVADLGSLQRLPDIIGQGHTRQLAFTGEDIGAGRALQIGLVNEVYDTPEALFEAARALAARAAANPPLVVQGVKQVLDHCRGRTVQDGLAYVAAWNAAFLQSHDLNEAMQAFMEKRPPTFRGA